MYEYIPADIQPHITARFGRQRRKFNGIRTDRRQTIQPDSNTKDAEDKGICAADPQESML